jgi:sulfide:quinone oxidoreductase
MTRILILGTGTAGTIMANRLRREYARDVRAGRTSITIVDANDRHVYQPGLLFLPFGKSSPEDIVRPRARQVHKDVVFVSASIDRVAVEQNRVFLGAGEPLDYDVLIVATGSRLAGATALRDKLATWGGGRLVIDIVDMPIKCPVAPLEFAFLADDFFTNRGMRDKVKIIYATPLDGAFTKATCSKALTHLLSEKGIELVTEFSAGSADGVARTLTAWDGQEIPFDVLVTIPVHLGAEFIARSPGLGDDACFVLTDPNTLQAKVSPNVFAIGDATNVPASKAGSVAHFEAEVLADNIKRFLAGQPLAPEFDGHANCFIETGHKKALLIDFNYAVEPLPGAFPIPVVGPMRLLAESRLNHLGKLAFRWVYWNVLLPGHDIPGVGPRMSMRGKHPVSPSSSPSMRSTS